MIIALLLVLLAGPAFAQEGIPGVDPAAAPPAAEQVDGITLEISAQLRCPVCQGLSIADSPSETAVTMKGRVHELVAQGYTEAQIRAYFIDRYGEWVLLSPPANGLGLVLWIAPIVFVVGAVGGALWYASRSVAPVAVRDDDEEDDDPYRRRMLAELEAE